MAAQTGAGGAGAAGGGAATLPNLFAELSRLGEQGEYERALRVVNKIIQEAPEDEKAFHCKIVCLIQLSKFDEALGALRKNSKLSAGLVFEKAYCEYRLNRSDEALRTIRSVGDPDARTKELLGQVLYRLESYRECYDTYRDLLKNSQDDFEEERETNLSAVMASLQMWGGENLESLLLREDTHEMCYNAACFLIGKGLYVEALAKLSKAEEICRKAFEDDSDSAAEDIEAELGIIWVQKGYVLQRLGQNDAAMKLYAQVVKQRPTDAALTAVASNNIVTLNKDQNVFDSKKKIRAATTDALKQKLASEQRRIIAMNECLLYHYMGQGGQCHQSAQALQKAHPDADTPYLIEAAQFLAEKNSNKAVESLQAQIARVKADTSALSLRLTLAQLYLGQEHVYQACDVLRSLGDTAHRPGIVSALVTLYLSQEDKDMAANVLKQAIDWHRANKPNSADLTTLIRANANFHLHHGSPQLAAASLEEMRQKDPTNLKVLARLIAAYSKFDAQKAHAVSKQLPSSEKLAKDVDVESLEASVGLLGSKYVKKTTRVDPSPRTGGSSGGLIQKKKPKKRKKVLPKNYDPSVTPDPERWLPLRERSYYRGKRRNKKRDINKGPQGSTAASGAELDASKPAVSPPGSDVGSPRAGNAPPASGGSTGPSASNPPDAIGPRQAKPAAASAKQRPKKKKSGKGGW